MRRTYVVEIDPNEGGLEDYDLMGIVNYWVKDSPSQVSIVNWFEVRSVREEPIGNDEYMVSAIR